MLYEWQHLPVLKLGQVWAGCEFWRPPVGRFFFLCSLWPNCHCSLIASFTFVSFWGFLWGQQQWPGCYEKSTHTHTHVRSLRKHSKTHSLSVFHCLAPAHTHASLFFSCAHTHTHTGCKMCSRFLWNLWVETSFHSRKVLTVVCQLKVSVPLLFIGYDRRPGWGGLLNQSTRQVYTVFAMYRHTAVKMCSCMEKLGRLKAVSKLCSKTGRRPRWKIHLYSF